MTRINHKKKSSLSTLVIAALSSTLFLTGCANMEATEKKANEQYKQAQNLANKANLQQGDSLIHFSEDIFISGKSFEVKPEAKRLPEVFYQKAGYNSNVEMTLASILRDLSEQSGISIRLTEDAKAYLANANKENKDKSTSNTPKPPLSASGQQDQQGVPEKLAVFYSGDFKGLLDHVSSGFSLWWAYDEESNTVHVYRYETRTFRLDMLLKSFKTKESVKNTTTNDISPQNISSEYDTGENKPWESAVNTLKALVGESGIVEPSPVAGFITVRTTPTLMLATQKYIDALNEVMRKRIALKIDIYDVQQKSGSNYGLNWDIVYKSTQGMLDWNTTNIANALPNPFSTDMKAGTLTAGLTSGNFSGTQFILSALQNVGKTTYVTGQTAYTVNGYPTAINISQAITYVKEKSISTIGNDSSNNVESSTIPGTVNTGFYLTFIPKIIKGNEVLLSLSFDMSSLLNMRESKTGSGDNVSYIELPTTQSKTFAQALPVKSGQAFILGAFNNTTANTGSNSIAGEEYWWAGGNKATSEEQTMTVIVVTPYIIGNL
ncbi:hypothetical protein [Cysteiniphilum marinum]|uniref:hypothetical protein n=1 Tax=Cysteiniphilum marinum TaxID=2774191 RepID=UPI001939497F|nr:hypothetical protein [Cysteiniphilum marinum]